ncbi:MAG: ATP-binding protein [Pleurocapsa sp. MO_192.B19]|nr:ATP-binding protein [Pleurocapsa sp. MO_192.B19]
MTQNVKAKANKSIQTNSILSKGIFWEARNRIFAWYILLITLLVGLSIPIFTRLVFLEVDQRVKEDIEEELESFQTIVRTIEFRTETSSQEKAAKIFDYFFRHKIPADKTFLIGTIDGQYYRSSPVGLPKVINQNSKLLNDLAQETKPIRVKNIVKDRQFGDLVYQSEPLLIDGQVAGVLIIAYITYGERQEVVDAMIIVIEVLVATFIVGLILAWIAAGKVLTPIRHLIQTARSVSDSDLSQRIPVQGKGEMGELAITFNRMMERLETSFISQREFINDAGHELRTPITIIRGHLELLEDDPQERAETIALVLDELDRMTNFIEDLILLATTEKEEFLAPQTIDIEQFTAELYAKVQGLASRNWELDTKAQGNLVGDRQKITQAIMNLVANAIQHTTITDTISLGSSVEQGYARFWVRDTGTGIALADHQRIFQRFARAANSRRRSEGAGLGLSIVQAIVQAHGGKMELHSQPGMGSTFTLILPLKATMNLQEDLNPD